MLFTYKVKTKTGEVIEDVIEAADKFSLARDLRQKGSVPISIEEQKKGFAYQDLLNRLLSRVSANELIIFTKNLSGMIKAGLSLHRALSVLEKQTRNQYFHKVMISLGEEINQGGSLSSGMAKFPGVFSSLFVSMTRAGEESGNLVTALSDIGGNLEKSHALTKKIHGALIYPGVILTAMLVIGILMFAFVVPTLASTFKELGIALPTSTKVLIAVGNFFSSHLIITFFLLLVCFGGLFALIRSKILAKYTDYLVVRLPLIGELAREINTARTTRTLSSLLLAGVSIMRAVEITGDVVQNVYYKKVLNDSKIALEKGAPFSETFKQNSNLYPIMMSEMVQVGEETGKLSEMLLNVAQFYEDEIDNKTKNLSTIIEPLLMIVIGGGVGFFAISMISPLYSILGNIG